MFDDGVEQRLQRGRRIFERRFGDAGLGVGIEHRKIELVDSGVEIDEQVVNFVEHFLRTRVLAIDLVDHDDGRQVRFERFREHVAGLRQRTFAGVDQQHDAVDDLERALDFAAEIAVARRIDDVDLDAAIADAGDLGEDGDAALALQIVRIHDAFDNGFVVAKDAALPQHGVDECGLAVVNVRDDGDVANAFVSILHVSLRLG